MDDATLGRRIQAGIFLAVVGSLAFGSFAVWNSKTDIDDYPSSLISIEEDGAVTLKTQSEGTVRGYLRGVGRLPPPDGAALGAFLADIDSRSPICGGREEDGQLYILYYGPAGHVRNVSEDFARRLRP